MLRLRLKGHGPMASGRARRSTGWRAMVWPSPLRRHATSTRRTSWATGSRSATSARCRALTRATTRAGMLITRVALAAGAGRVIVSDIDAAKLEIIEAFDPRVTTVNARNQDVEGFVLDITAGQGVDAVFEASGAISAASSVFGPLRPGGTVVYVGMPAGAVSYDPRCGGVGPRLPRVSGHRCGNPYPWTTGTPGRAAGRGTDRWPGWTPTDPPGPPGRPPRQSCPPAYPQVRVARGGRMPTATGLRLPSRTSRWRGAGQSPARWPRSGWAPRSFGDRCRRRRWPDCSGRS